MGGVALGHFMRWDILVYPDKDEGPLDGNLNDASRVSLHTLDGSTAYLVLAYTCVCLFIHVQCG